MDEKDVTLEMIDKRMSVEAPDEYRRVLAGFRSMSGRDILNTLIERQRPHELVRRLSCQDFYWLVKKVGEEDCLPLIALASEAQWQFLLDLELWNEDRLEVSKSFQWISRLQHADLPRVAGWFFGEGQALCYMYLFRHLQVEFKTDDEPLQDLPEGFFTLDGVYYFRPLDRRQAPEFEALLRAMAAEDQLRYHAVLAGLSGLIPAEAEEEMYRMRSVRLAEHGFLPREEAVSVYSPLPLSAAVRGSLPAADPDPEIVCEAALVPLMLAPGTGGLFSEVAPSIGDPVLLDRLRLEFSGLCNLIMSADGMIPEEIQDVEKICRKAAGYVNVALEQMCGEDLPRAVLQVKDTTLLTLFRVGLGLAVDIGRHAGRWVSRSWWSACGLPYGFWGEHWGGCLQGILQSKPVFHSGIEGDEEFRDFRNIDEIRQCASSLEKVMALDDLLKELTADGDSEPRVPPGPEITVQAMLITLWARERMGLEQDFSPVSLDEARRFFSLLRGGDSGKSRIRKSHRDHFVRFFMDKALPGGAKPAETLNEALSDVWDEFCGEYRDVAAKDLDPRFSRLLVIEPFDGAGPA